MAGPDSVWMYRRKSGDWDGFLGKFSVARDPEIETSSAA